MSEIQPMPANLASHAIEKPQQTSHQQPLATPPAHPSSGAKAVDEATHHNSYPQVHGSFPTPPTQSSQNQHQLASPNGLGSNGNPVHPNAKTTTHINNGTTTTKTNISSPVCHNCRTQTTPLWRRDEMGQVLCNACGLFLKLHGRPRPISLKTDTIKSRNRVKQGSNGSTKSSSPNTPKLESKDSKSVPPSAKKSPRLSAKKDPRPFANPHMPNYNHHLQTHLSHPAVQPLHYPSSTPTQFAPGLQRITSPLLLSTTSSISNTRGSNAAASSIHQAAGALENMSNELGPSATFQKNKITTPISLINNKAAQIKREPSPVFSTPSSALNYSKNPISSPSFGAQYHLLNSNEKSLPPIQQVASFSKPNLPHIGNFTKEDSQSLPSGSNNSNTPPGNRANKSSKDNSSNNNNNNNNNDQEEITILKTRISELELVNDLYRTRIMELEAAEHAARLRESSMRKRLDEIISLKEGDAKRARYN